ncbi:MAG: glycosyltransferase family 2 protein [Crocinitomicaceae bacterium]|nr:glycosyltransferase family 2 protein [Crocinitomicaceae bacterium]
MSSIDLSIVVPFFNEEENVSEVYAELNSVLNELDLDYEIIFVNDGSTDNTDAEIKSICNTNASTLGLSLSRNYGHQIALIAGLEHAKGDLVLSMDGDLQHPASLIQSLIDKAKSGFDVVNTIRIDEEGIKAGKKLSSKWFYTILNSVSDVPVRKSSSDFRLMNRKSLDAFLKMKEKDRFNRGLVSWMGFRQAFIEFEARPRQNGQSKFTPRKMWSFAGDGIFAFSSKPLRVSFYLGVVVSFLSLIYIAYSVSQYFLGNTVPGWTSLLVTVLFLGGIQLLSIGIMGEYIRRIFNEVKGRPLYFVQEYHSKSD